MLLDTSFLIDVMRGDEDAVARADELEEDMIRQRISAMTLFELYYGVERSEQPEDERETVEDVLATEPVQPADAAVMRAGDGSRAHSKTTAKRSPTGTSSSARQRPSSANRC